MLRIIFLLCVLSSAFIPLCQSTKKGETSSNYCKSINILFQEETPKCVLKFKENYNKEQIKKTLITEFGQDFLDTVPAVNVNIPLLFDQYEVNISVKFLHGLNKTTGSEIYCGLRPDYLHILINSKDEFLVDGNFSIIDSLASDVFKYYNDFSLLERYAFDDARIIIKWQDLTSPACLEKTLYQLCQGYIYFVQDWKQIELCRLTKKEIVHFRDEFPFNVVFIMNEVYPDEEIEIIDPVEVNGK
ncbi:MAG: hypothetical protein IPM74_17595 [Crocinitomicaceae bacterium]|nr:hypothetical protein [Crocinitomicaceae bacterium]MBK8927661.1 hypothetical protein [Crocinitomicaceae bacterium]